MADESEIPTVADFLVPEEEAAPVTEPEVPEELTADDLPLEDEPAAEIAEEESEEGAEEEQKAPAVPMPASWSKEDKAAWEALDPAAQAVVQRREKDRDDFIHKASYEAKNARQQVETQARDIIAKQHEDYAQRLQVFAQQILPQPPDQRLLYTNNQDDVLVYNRQDAAYRAATDQQAILHQQIAQAQQQATLHREQAQQAERASDAQRLKDQLPEWFDPSEGPKLQQSLQSIGAELGYPVELMAEASSADILALKKAAEWKSDAEKYRALQRSKMETVRAAKGLPKMARPGAATGKGQQQAAAVSRREQALESFGYTRSATDAAALLLERKR